MGKEYWSTECKMPECGEKVHVEEWVRDAIVNFQRSPETADVPKDVEGDDLQESLRCPHCICLCVFDAEHSMVKSTKEGHLWFITPESWTQELFEEEQRVWGSAKISTDYVAHDKENSDIAIMHIPKNCTKEEMGVMVMYTPT